MNNLLNEINEILNCRQDIHGNPEDSFQLIADFWDVYLRWIITKAGGVVPKNFKLTELDVVHMLSLFKHARMLGQKPHRDNYIDACGYLVIAADRLIPKLEKKKNEVKK